MPRSLSVLAATDDTRLKCNRSHPCENCVRRGDASGCSYAASGPRKKGQGVAATGPDDMQNRINRLEGLVLSLMTNGASAPGPTAAQAAVSRSGSERAPVAKVTTKKKSHEVGYGEDTERRENDDSEVDEVSDSFGIMKMDAEAEKSMYLGDNHWHMVLSDVRPAPRGSQGLMLTVLRSPK